MERPALRGVVEAVFLHRIPAVIVILGVVQGFAEAHRPQHEILFHGEPFPGPLRHQPEILSEHPARRPGLGQLPRVDRRSPHEAVGRGFVALRQHAPGGALAAEVVQIVPVFRPILLRHALDHGGHFPDEARGRVGFAADAEGGGNQPHQDQPADQGQHGHQPPEPRPLRPPQPDQQHGQDGQRVGPVAEGHEGREGDQGKLQDPVPPRFLLRKPAEQQDQRHDPHEASDIRLIVDRRAVDHRAEGEKSAHPPPPRRIDLPDQQQHGRKEGKGLEEGIKRHMPRQPQAEGHEEGGNHGEGVVGLQREGAALQSLDHRVQHGAARRHADIGVRIENPRIGDQRAEQRQHGAQEPDRAAFPEPFLKKAPAGRNLP